LRWTCKSVRRLAQALQAQGHEVSRTLVARLLNEAGYSLQGNRKTTEGDSHPDRDAQFGYINTQVTTALAENQPVISVDTKKKELVGDFCNNGREYRPQGDPEEVRVHDFLIKELGRAVPYGVYDLAANSGWVSVGVDHDTAAFAVNSIRQWWLTVGRGRYPNATRLLITATPAPAKAGGGGSNGSRVRLWKRELQKLANQLGIDIVVSHLPPGTSKWNKIEHRLFSFISQNWRAKPLVSYRVIVELISATTTKTGLTVRCQLDTGQYPSGHCRIGCRDGRHQHPARRVPRRVELHHLTRSSSPKSRVYLVTGPKARNRDDADRLPVVVASADRILHTPNTDYRSSCSTADHLTPPVRPDWRSLRGSLGSHETPRWRKADSNRWSHFDRDAFQNTILGPGATHRFKDRSASARGETDVSNPLSSSRQSVSIPEPLSKVENPAFGAGLRGWLGDRVGRDAGMF
jgi:Rhodopirellula transposase DDE domain